MSLFSKRLFWIFAGAAVVLVAILSTPAGRDLAGNWLGSLRVQKVQAVNLNLSPFTDANANPALHQMVSQMISDKVDVVLNEPNQPATDRASAGAAAGFTIQLPAARRTRRSSSSAGATS